LLKNREELNPSAIFNMIETKRLKLIRWNDAHFQAIFDNNLVQLGELLDCNTPKEWTTFPDMADALPFFYESFKQNGNYWGSFFTIHKADRQLLGTCGFKWGPDADGAVEIGYEVTEAYRQQGLASEAAAGLVHFAFQHSPLKLVRAHTLAKENPSVSVLKKLGFTFIGLFNDPDDGDIWRFELPRKVS
jgi:[ribosomal protein S5]-alanine N-acetyltransferase